MCATKRGAHLAVSLERLDALLDAPAQRIGLSATVRPVDEVATFLAGGRPVTVVQPPAQQDGRAAGRRAGRGHVRARRAHRRPDRRGGRRAAAHLDLAARRGARARPRRGPPLDDRVRQLAPAGRAADRPAERTGHRTRRAQLARDGRAAGPADGASPGPAHPTGEVVVARAHHGSVSREQRALVEEDLKAGRLPAVVATSSLELGIDMGAVDLVVQVESPPSVAVRAAAGRPGRAPGRRGVAGRDLPEVPRRPGRVRGRRRADARRARSSRCATRATRSTCSPSRSSRWSRWTPLTVDEVEELVRRAAPFAGLPRSALEAVLDMLAGRYPSDAFAELRPRLVWDRVTGELTARRGAQRLAVTSGGTIPDRGLFGVFLAGADGPGPAGRRAGRGDGLRVAGRRRVPARLVVVADRGHHPRPGAGHARRRARSAGCRSGRATRPGRPVELGRALGRVPARGGQRRPPTTAAARAHARPGWTNGAPTTCSPTCAEQRDGHPAPARRPDDPGRAVPRRARRLAAGRPLAVRRAGQRAVGAGDRRPAARALRPGGVVHALRRRHRAAPAGHRRRAAGRRDSRCSSRRRSRRMVTAEVGGSALFASRFRECAARSLLLPRRDPRRRTPLWQQRQRANQLLQVASEYGDFPVVLEAMRECLQDVFDVPGLVGLMRDLAVAAGAGWSRSRRRPRRRSRGRCCSATSACSCTRATRRWPSGAPRRCRSTRRCWPNCSAPPTCASCSTPDAIAAGRGRDRPARTGPAGARPRRRARPAARGRRPDDRGGASRAGPPRRTSPRWRRPGGRSGSGSPASSAGWRSRTPAGSATRSAPRCRSACPRRSPSRSAIRSAIWCRATPARTARSSPRTSRPGSASASRSSPPRWPGWPLPGRLVAGRVPPGRRRAPSGATPRCCARSGAARWPRCAREVEPVPHEALARFVPGLAGARCPVEPRRRRAAARGRAARRRAAAGERARVARAAGRVADYSPALLDELTLAGEVVWAGAGALPGNDGWIALAPAEIAPLVLPPPDAGRRHRWPGALRDALRGDEALFFRALADRAIGSAGFETDEAVAARGLGAGLGRAAHQRHAGPGPRAARPGPHRAPAQAPRAAGPLRPLRAASPRPAARRRVAAGAARHGRALVGRPGPRRRPHPARARRRRRAARPVRRRHPRRGGGRAGHRRLRRGVPGAQGGRGVRPGPPRLLRRGPRRGAVRAARRGRPAARAGPAGRVARARPARRAGPGRHRPGQPYGAALPWPEAARPEDGWRGHQPARKAGALVVLVDGACVLYVERGGRTLLSFTDDATLLQPAADALALAVRDGALGKLAVERADGLPVSGSPLGEALAAAGFRPTPRGLRLRG